MINSIGIAGLIQVISSTMLCHISAHLHSDRSGRKPWNTKQSSYFENTMK